MNLEYQDDQIDTSAKLLDTTYESYGFNDDPIERLLTDEYHCGKLVSVGVFTSVIGMCKILTIIIKCTCINS